MLCVCVCVCVCVSVCTLSSVCVLIALLIRHTLNAVFLYFLDGDGKGRVGEEGAGGGVWKEGVRGRGTERAGKRWGRRGREGRAGKEG